MAYKEQLEILSQGVKTWNDWRNANPWVKPDLSRANLREANLIDANLSGVRLRRADLQEASLQGAKLGDAKLEDANLSRAYLHGADLRRADLKLGYGNDSCKNEPFAPEQYKSLSALLMRGLTHRLC